MPALVFPPFPDDVPTHPLLIIDYELLKRRDVDEINRLWDASTKLGFWYLKNHGADELVDEMFAMGAETMALPLSEKMEYEQGDEGISFGYKAAGANAVDATGELDTVEFLNISKDDALAWPKQAHRAYPRTAVARMESTITPFVRKSLEVNNLILEIFNERLGLPKGTLLSLHTEEEYSGSETRLIRNPATQSTTKKAIGSHTDFGSISFLHNRLGGLQVFVPGAESWQYVKPIPRHAICNVGDALAIMSGGILRSNLHRVIPPPGAQSGFERWSLVFFTRPGNSAVLRALTEKSDTIAEAVKKTPEKSFDTGSTSKDWFARRIKNQRIKNRTASQALSEEYPERIEQPFTGARDVDGKQRYRGGRDKLRVGFPATHRQTSVATFKEQGSHKEQDGLRQGTMLRS